MIDLHKLHGYSRLAFEHADKACAFTLAANEFWRVETFVIGLSIFLVTAGTVLIFVSVVEYSRTVIRLHGRYGQ